MSVIHRLPSWRVSFLLQFFLVNSTAACLAAAWALASRQWLIVPPLPCAGLAVPEECCMVVCHCPGFMSGSSTALTAREVNIRAGRIKAIEEGFMSLNLGPAVPRREGRLVRSATGGASVETT